MVWFDEMGIYKMLSLIPDPLLRKEMGEDLLMPLLAHDKAHGTDYVEMLEIYLETGGSIKAVAEQTFTHRNTAIYRLGNIRKLLGNDLESPEDRLRYQIACMLLHTPEPIDIT
jgi:DNA-binding PucR family transcriptional regulator